MSAVILWKLVLTHREPQVPEALRSPALAHLATVLDRPAQLLDARLADGATLATTQDAEQAARWQSELTRAGWRTELRQAVQVSEAPAPQAPASEMTLTEPAQAADIPAQAFAPAPALASAPAPRTAPAAVVAAEVGEMPWPGAPVPTGSAASPATGLAATADAGQTMACPSCGAGNAPQANFCARCGQSLDHLPAMPGERGSGALLGAATSKVASMAGLKAASRFSFSDLLSETFTRRSPQEIESYMSVGTLSTTPPLAQISAEWPRPWLFARLFLSAMLMALLLYGAIAFLGGGVAVPGLLIVGCFVMPLSVVLLFYELNTPRNVTLIYVTGLILMGGILSIFVSMVMFRLFPVLGSLVGASSAGMIEELGKLLTVVYATRRLSAVRYRYILNGLLFGAAVGAGFAAFESAGYAMDVLLASKSLNTAVLSIAMRGWMSPFAHVLWTALTAGALWRVKGARSYSGAMLGDWRFVRVFLISMTCHAIWNADIVPVGPFMLKYWVLGAVGWMVALSLVQEGLEQVRREQRTVGG